MFDDSIDLVVWGHEHDCRIDPEPVAGKSYSITQPGSSVATSLADGESIEKYVITEKYALYVFAYSHRHVALVTIKGKEYSLEPIPLRTVRPFVLDDVALNEVAEEEGFELDDQMAINKFLKKRVRS